MNYLKLFEDVNHIYNNWSDMDPLKEEIIKNVSEVHDLIYEIVEKYEDGGDVLLDNCGIYINSYVDNVSICYFSKGEVIFDKYGLIKYGNQNNNYPADARYKDIFTYNISLNGDLKIATDICVELESRISSIYDLESVEFGYQLPNNGWINVTDYKGIKKIQKEASKIKSDKWVIISMKIRK